MSLPHPALASTSTRPLTIRAAVLHAPGQMTVQEVKIAPPGPGQVRIKIEACGVCASNLEPWQGQPWFSYPMEPGALGHEACGVIEAVGPDISQLTVGQRVASLSTHAYAEFDLASADKVVPLPSDLGNAPFLGEPLSCAVNIHKRTGICPGDTVAIVGFGFQGALLSQLAHAAGAIVVAISRRPYALEVARSSGATHTLTIDDQILSQIEVLTGGRLCDVVIEAAGKQQSLELASKLVRERGRLVIAGYHQDGPRQIDMQLWNWRGLDVINAHERSPSVYRDGVVAAIQAVRTGALNPAPLYTHELPLDRLGHALDLGLRRPNGFMKAIIRP